MYLALIFDVFVNSIFSNFVAHPKKETPRFDSRLSHYFLPFILFYVMLCYVMLCYFIVSYIFVYVAGCHHTR